MSEPKVALMSFGDERPHEWEKVFAPLAIPRHRQAINYLKRLPISVHADEEVVRTKTQIDDQVDRLRSQGVEVLVAHIPCWTSPNLVVRGIQRMDLPTILITSKSAATHGCVGLLGAGGALTQIGFPHFRIREDLDSPTLANRLLPIFRAASTTCQLRGKVFGLFGGRSLGIDTGTFDPMQWRRQFGVDVEHIDQLDIIRRAEDMDFERTDRMVRWLAANTAGIQYNETGLTPEKLAFQVSCYLSTKDIIKEKGLDFLAVKCMPDLSNNHVPQCISACILPSPYDGDGKKEPVAMACEADGDGALTMEMLKLISGGFPVMFGDISHINDQTKTLYLPNCGAICSWFAGRSDQAEENLKHIELRPSVRPGGGAVTYFTGAPGPITLSRLYRVSGKYRMAIIPGEAIRIPETELAEFVKARGKHQLPTLFVKVKMNTDHLIEAFGSNHVSGVAGDYLDDLTLLCRMLDITPVVMDETF